MFSASMNFQRPKRVRVSGTARSLAVILTFSLLGLGLVGCGNKNAGSGADKPVGGAGAAKLDRAGLGSDMPKVDVLAFVGYQCPHCRASAAEMLAFAEANKETTRVRILNLPLDAHPDSVALARAAVAARRLGLWRKWWDHAFASDTADAATIMAFAALEGVDKAKFEAALASDDVAAEVATDVAIAAALGVAGTPSYLVNGALLQGAQDKATWDGIVKAQTEAAAKLLADGTAPAGLLDALVKANSPKRAPFYKQFVTDAQAPPASDVPAKVVRKSGVVGAQIQPAAGGAAPLGQRIQFGVPPSDPNTVWRVLVRSDDPIRGPANAPVSIVVFGDFECPHTRALQQTLATIVSESADSVRVVWKHNPLQIHPHAMVAARASEAARAQGKFWELHDKLMALETPDAGAIDGVLAAVGIDQEAFRNAMTATGVDDRITADLEQVNALAIRGTPNLFVNGRLLVGAPTVEVLRDVVAAAKAAAQAMLDAGTPADKIYEKIVGEGKLLESLSPEVHAIDTTLGVTRGAPGAAIHIVAFQDLQCPFCARLEPHIVAAEAQFDGRVKVTWMDYPLVDIHPNALEAAQAGREAAAQGKFTAFRDVAMVNQDKLHRAGLLELGERAGLDVKKLDKALQSGKWKKDVEASIQIAKGLGLKGTPSVFINGHAFSPQMGFSANTFAMAISRLLRARE